MCGSHIIEFFFIAFLLTSSISIGIQVEGSGEIEENFISVTKEYGNKLSPIPTRLDRTFLWSMLSAKNSDFMESRPLNSTVQLELLRIDEELFRARIGLTMWIHQQWKNTRFAFPDGITINRLKVPLDVLSSSFTPQTVVKNALFFKEHRTPLLNGFISLDSEGTFVSHRKVTVDLACIRNFGKTASEKFSVCARGNVDKKDFRWGETICELRYGSFINDRAVLKLDWHFNAILTQTVPCIGGRKPNPHNEACRIRETRTLRKVVEFFSTPYDELVACFIIDLLN